MELDREDFRLWLAAKDPNENAGEWGGQSISTGCPLARWLTDRFGVQMSYATGGWGPVEFSAAEALSLYGENCEWARRFEDAHDSSLGAETRTTAKDALTILDSDLNQR